MNVQHTFRKLVYAQVLLGMSAFCFAEGNLGLLLITGTIAMLSWPVVEAPGGKPLPRWLINIASLIAVAMLFLDLEIQRGKEMAVLIAMGHFTMWLQALELYSKKSNRDYGLILVLSLLQMIGGSVLSVSLLFGVAVFAYSILTMFTVLLFQMKAMQESVDRANGAATPHGFQPMNAQTVAGGTIRSQFRRFALRVGLLCGVIAALIFIAIPRTSRFSNQNTLTRLIQDEVGFSEMVDLRSSPTQQQQQRASQDVVLNLKVFREGVNIGRLDRAWLLRGTALDSYDPEDRVWVRSTLVKRQGDAMMHLRDRPGELRVIKPDASVIEAEITLRSVRSRILFSLHPAAEITSNSLNRVTTNFYDDTLAMVKRPSGSPVYTIRTTVDPADATRYVDRMTLRRRRGSNSGDGSSSFNWPRDPYLSRLRIAAYAQGWPVEAARVRDHTLAILRENNLSRNIYADLDPNDAKIAEALTRYLGENPQFQYALNNPPPAPGKDPVIEFLFELKHGHCELYAAALAAMARSIGMRARVVTGYRASEFNSVGGYYVVRQSNAHAWTEIYIDDRWVTFDATPAAAVEAEHAVSTNFLTWVRQVYDTIEIGWLTGVVAFDKETRDAMLGAFRGLFTRDEASGGGPRRWLATLIQLWNTNKVLIMVGVVIAIAILMIAINALRQWLKRRRRMRSIKIEHLPREQRRALVKSLQFFFAMEELLAKHGLRRPHWQSPRQFAQHVAGQPDSATASEPMLALTEQYYDVRYGHRPLNEDRRSLVQRLMDQLRARLGSKGEAGT